MRGKVETKKVDSGARVREIARERLGTVPPSKVMVPKPARKKPKHKKPLSEQNPGE